MLDSLLIRDFLYLIVFSCFEKEYYKIENLDYVHN